MEYPKDGASGDEVEDLRALLAGVKKAMPEVNAVCSGAILSDYQRLRVESVCADLGLTSIIAQKGTGVRCVYAALGAQASRVNEVAKELEGAHHHRHRWR